jgi:hypothetical protein
MGAGGRKRAPVYLDRLVGSNPDKFEGRLRIGGQKVVKVLYSYEDTLSWLRGVTGDPIVVRDRLGPPVRSSQCHWYWPMEPNQVVEVLPGTGIAYDLGPDEAMVSAKSEKMSGHCRISRASGGRCDPGESCEHYEKCLEVAFSLDWPGWKGRRNV